MTEKSAIDCRLADILTRLRIPVIQIKIYDEILTPEEREQVDHAKHVLPADKVYAKSRGVSHRRAIVELAYEVNLIPPADRDRLLRQLVENPVSTPTNVPQLHWNRSRGELLFEGTIVRRIRSIPVAVNIVAILDAFQSAHWKNLRVIAPLRDSQAIRESVSSLNKGLRSDAFRFECDGSGEGVVVRFVDVASANRQKRKLRRRNPG